MIECLLSGRIMFQATPSSMLLPSGAHTTPVGRIGAFLKQ